MASSPEADAVKEARKNLDEIKRLMPDNLVLVSAAQSKLQAARSANGTKEPNCLQSAEATFQNTGEHLEAVHADQAARREQILALQASLLQGETDLLEAEENKEAAQTDLNGWRS